MPSGHIEFHHIFQLCSDDLFRPINYSSNEISTINEEVNNQLLQFKKIKHVPCTKAKIFNIM